MVKGSRLLKPLLEKVILADKQYHFFDRDDHILVALSGGPDSVFLLLALLQLQKKYKYSLSAAHVNHGLRGNAALSDEIFCAEFCKTHGVPLYTTRVQLQQIARRRKMSVEEAGRYVRYRFFEELSTQHAITKVATAHTIDDNLESVIMSVFAGTGLSGLQGIAPVYGKIIRPVITIAKAQLLAYLQGAGVAYRVDESNNSMEYRRNFVRHKLVPLIEAGINPGASEAVFTLSTISRNVNGFIASQVNQLYPIVVKMDKKRCEITVEELGRLHPFLQSEIVKRCFGELGMVRVQSEAIEKVLVLQHAETGKQVVLSANRTAVRERQLIVIGQVKNAAGSAGVNGTITASGRLQYKSIVKNKVKIGGDPSVEYIDADALTGALVIRRWRQGDVFYPIGLSGKKKVSDFLNSLKLSPDERASVDVVTDDNNIIWVAGRRLDERYKLTGETKHILQLTYIVDGKSNN